MISLAQDCLSGLKELMCRSTRGLLRMSSSSEKLKVIKGVVSLTKAEDKLFRTLLATVKHFNLKTTMRVAGGWVRDKMLGKESDDIDIALDNMMGKAFADKINQYLESMGERKARYGVILANPEQSKHLETAQMHIWNMSVDFVNLRSEHYTQDSRIPDVAFGTPLEDALRRDLTINSLFYNINQGIVEDFTGLGFDDLDAGRVRTPLPPKTTFLDDPLRVLRSVRFASRFDFKVEESLMAAASDVQVHSALEKKVSRERVGTELNGMLKAKKPNMAVSLLTEMKLLEATFLPKSLRDSLKLFLDEEPITVTGEDLQTTIPSAFALIYALLVELSKEEALKIGFDEKRTLMLASILSPLRNVYSLKKTKKIWLTNTVILEALKLKAQDAQEVSLLHSLIPEYEELAGLLNKSPKRSRKDEFDEVASLTLHKCILSLNYACIGMLLRFEQPSTSGSPNRQGMTFTPAESLRIKTAFSIRRAKNLWKAGFILACASGSPKFREIRDAALDANNDKSLSDLVAEVKVCYDAVDTMNLSLAYKAKPLLDGKRIMQELDVKSQGPEVGILQEKVLEFQFAKPECEQRECIEFLKKMKLESM